MENILCSPVSKYEPKDFIFENHFKKKITPPKLLDYRMFLKKVRNQSNYGSSVAFSLACIKEFYEKRTINFTSNFSPMFIYDSRENKAIKGLSCKEGLKFIQKKGIVSERTYPFIKNDDKRVKLLKDKELVDKAKRFRISSYSKIMTLDGLKRALYYTGPCLIMMPVYNYKQNMWIPEHDEDQCKGFQCLTVVGYNKKSFILRNSWGSGWGDNGYCYYDFKNFGYHAEAWCVVNKEDMTYCCELFEDENQVCCCFPKKNKN